MTVNDIITKAGGAQVVAEITGSSRDAVRKWRQLGAIPGRHWPKLVEHTEGRVSYDDLHALARAAGSVAAGAAG